MASNNPRTLPRRSDLTVDQRWNIESIFATDAAWEAEYERLSGRLHEFEQYRGRVGSSAQTLLAVLRLRDEILAAIERLGSYAFLRESEDATNTTYTAMADRMLSFEARVGKATAFIEPELLQIDPEVLDRYVSDEPDLTVYQHYFHQLNLLREHTRSVEVEELLAQASDVTSGYAGVRGALENADLRLGTITDEEGNSVELGQGNLLHYLHSTDRNVRQSAWTSAADAYASMKHTFAGTLSGGVKRDVFYTNARNFNSSLEASLAPNDIPTEVFHNLIDTVWKNLPTWRRYFAIRRRVLGYDTLHEWDITAPLIHDTRKVPFDQGVEMIVESLEPLGGQYVDILRRGIADHWVDPYPNAGKGGGAFSGGSPGTHPFISMNYQDDIHSVSTLSHELGHSLHSYYAWQAQPYVYCDYSMFAAEAASNMHQALMGRKLLDEQSDPDFLIEIIEERMSNHLRYFFTMPILARFELDCHEKVERGEPLTADGMSNTLVDLYEEAYGGEVAVDRERMGITWARFPHLFVNFYVFQYATGISAAAQMAQQVFDEGEPAARRYIDFLKAGDSKFPIDALRDAGVDMREPGPVQAAFDILAGYVDRLDELTR